MDDSRFDVAVVGAGPSGLLAAIRAAERGRSTVLLEKNGRPGVKILISGGGRCNLTHACDERGIAAAFGAAGRFLRSPLAAFGPAKLVDWLHEEGVPTYVEAGGKVFPASDRAADVLDALLARLRRSGAQLAPSESVVDIRQAAQGFLVATARRSLHVGAVIVATGGMSYPTCGTTGDGYRWLVSLGHTIRTPRPALVPLTTEAAWVRRLAGIALPDVLVRVVDPGPAPNATCFTLPRGGSDAVAAGEGYEKPSLSRDLPSPLVPRDRPGERIMPKVMRKASGIGPASSPSAEGRAAASLTIAERRGAVLFTHFGLSGPAPMDVSRAVTLHENPRSLRLLMDFLPDVRADDLDASIRRLAAEAGRKRVASLLPRLFAVASLFPTRLAEALMEKAGMPIDRRGAELGKGERAGLVTWLKQAEVVPSGSCGFGQAEVTTGGVELGEVDSRTMESKLVPGLYITGELLDLDGFIGGFNLQAAFSTGWQAGEHA